MKLVSYSTLFFVILLILSGCGGGSTSTSVTQTTAEISGQVSLSGTGIDGVSLTLSGDDNAILITQNGGKYSFENLKPGKYKVTAELVGYEFIPEVTDIILVGGDKSTCNIEAIKLGIHVPEDAATLQLAINQSINGETIYVDDGVYHGIGNVAVTFGGKSVTLKSKYGPNNCIIDCGGVNQGFIFSNNEDRFSVIKGFTIKNCQGDWGAAIELRWASPSIIGNIFDSNGQMPGGFGAAIGGNGSSPIIDKNIFMNNTCDGQYLSGVASFVNSSSPIIQNNIFHDNNCRAINMTIPTGNAPRITNNTIVRNQVGIHVDRRVDTSGQTFQNNIITDNVVGLEVVFGQESYNPIWKNNLVYNNTINYDGIVDQTNLNGNISLNPLFVNSSTNQFQLQSNSPAIDTGILLNSPQDDYDGILRPQGIGIDLGAYEYHQ